MRLRWLLRILALLLGLVAAELGMRLVGWGGATLYDRATDLSECPSARAILCIGDSCVWGPNFKPEQSYPARLSEHLKRATDAERAVFNFGKPGRPSWEVAEELPALLELRSFDVVLVTVGYNNLWRGRPRWYDGLRLWKLARLVAARVRGKTSVQPRALEQPLMDEDRIAAQLRADLGRAQTSAREHATPLVIVCYGTDLGNYGIANRCLRRVARELALPLIDPVPLLDRLVEQSSRTQVFFIDLHPKPPGYELIARAVYDELGRMRLHAGAPFAEPLAGLLEQLSTRPLADIERLMKDGVESLVVSFHEGPPGSRCLAYVWEAPDWPKGEGVPHVLPQMEQLMSQIGEELRDADVPHSGGLFTFDQDGLGRVALEHAFGGRALDELRGYRFQASYLPLREHGGRMQIIPNSIAPPVTLEVP